MTFYKLLHAYRNVSQMWFLIVCLGATLLYEPLFVLQSPLYSGGTTQKPLSIRHFNISNTFLMRESSLIYPSFSPLFFFMYSFSSFVFTPQFICPCLFLQSIIYLGATLLYEEVCLTFTHLPWRTTDLLHKNSKALINSEL